MTESEQTWIGQVKQLLHSLSTGEEAVFRSNDGETIASVSHCIHGYNIRIQSCSMGVDGKPEPPYFDKVETYESVEAAIGAVGMIY